MFSTRCPAEVGQIISSKWLERKVKLGFVSFLQHSFLLAVTSRTQSEPRITNRIEKVREPIILSIVHR